jgi:hypothetical protein
VKLVVVLVAALALTGCKKSPENKDLVRQGVLDYLASRPNLSIASMNVEVSAVTFRGDEADATVTFAPKGSTNAQGMSMHYTLERKGDRWVVKGRADSGGHGAGMPGAMGGGGANPHGGAMGGGAGGGMPMPIPQGTPTPAAPPGEKK